MAQQKLWRGILAAAALSFAAAGGCAFLAAGNERQEGKSVVAEYEGLADKSVAIVVFVDPATANEFSSARQEISEFSAAELRKAVPTVRIVDPRVVVRWQDDTINWFALSERDIGKHFGVDRVLFIELLEYSTKVPGAQGYVQGRIRSSAKIFETDGDLSKAAAPAWSGAVEALWPPDGPTDFRKMNEVAVRKNVLQRYGEKLAGRMYSHKQVDGRMRDRDTPQ